jgi:pescadillo protein
MARVFQKKSKGNAKNFVSRTQAIRKLQVSLADFRRLCIFKGIYPREPRNKKKANRGSTKQTTFYYHKDIQFLLHEPILNKFREHKTFSKKLNKFINKGEFNVAKSYEANNKPNYKLDKVIKERYPSFLDALRDIDDALNMLFLFSIMPVTSSVSSRIITTANKLCQEWLAYVSKERCLRKVFVSIKGIYYEAVVKGVEVRWLQPFKFPQVIPNDIDFKIMLTFLEFYSTLLHFVLYKLYGDIELVYPPKLNSQKLKGIGGLSAFILESSNTNVLQDGAAPSSSSNSDEVQVISAKSIKAAMKADSSKKDEVEEDEENTESVQDIQLDHFEDNSKNAGDLLVQPSNTGNAKLKIFENFIFFVNREVPFDVLEFLILSFGGKVISELTLDELALKNETVDENLLKSVTHQIVDRPKVNGKVQGRTYVQPQWIFDSINKGELLAVNDYLPGETLPPHLSPWGDAGGYNPEEQIEEGEESESEDEEIEGEEDEDAEVEIEEEEEDEDEELEAQKELELEVKGVKYSDAKEILESEPSTSNKKRKQPSSKSTEAEEKELKMIMMSNKQRKLYKKMKYSNEKKETRQEELRDKRKKIEKTKKKLNNLKK